MSVDQPCCRGHGGRRRWPLCGRWQPAARRWAIQLWRPPYNDANLWLETTCPRDRQAPARRRRLNHCGTYGVAGRHAGYERSALRFRSFSLHAFAIHEASLSVNRWRPVSARYPARMAHALAIWAACLYARGRTAEAARVIGECLAFSGQSHGLRPHGPRKRRHRTGRARTIQGGTRAA